MEQQATFWDHLDELRSVIMRILIAVVGIGVVAFCFKDTLFAFVLGPQSSGFITYQWFDSLTFSVLRMFGQEANYVPVTTDFNVRLINTELAQQFIIHMKVAMSVGLLLASPYVLYQLFHFVSPALYQRERRVAIRLICGAYLMFIVGSAFAYLILFPFTFMFLGTYQVADFVENTITLESYITTLMSMMLIIGLIFEMPMLSWMLARMHMLKAHHMTSFRKHVIVAILIIAAVITPTSDAFTLMLVSIPMWLLYELSVLIVRREQ